MSYLPNRKFRIARFLGVQRLTEFPGRQTGGLHENSYLDAWLDRATIRLPALALRNI